MNLPPFGPGEAALAHDVSCQQPRTSPALYLTSTIGSLSAAGADGGTTGLLGAWGATWL